MAATERFLYFDMLGYGILACGRIDSGLQGTDSDGSSASNHCTVVSPGPVRPPPAEGFRGSLRSAYMSGPYAPRSLNRAFCRNKTGSEYRTNGFLKQAMRFLEFRKKSFSTPMQVLRVGEGCGQDRYVREKPMKVVLRVFEAKMVASDGTPVDRGA